MTAVLVAIAATAGTANGSQKYADRSLSVAAYGAPRIDRM
jgi:hypothetical protein